MPHSSTEPIAYWYQAAACHRRSGQVWRQEQRCQQVAAEERAPCHRTRSRCSSDRDAAVVTSRRASSGSGILHPKPVCTSGAQCAKQPACLGLNTERPVHRTSPALFMPWSDAPGLSAHTLAVRSVGQEDGSPQWGVVHEHTRRPTPVFMNTFFSIRIFTDRPGHVGVDHQHLNNTRQLPSTGLSMVCRCSTAKFDFGLLTPDFPLFMNKQRRLLCALAGSLGRRSSDARRRSSRGSNASEGSIEPLTTPQKAYT